MRLNELISEFRIYVNNEENEMLNKMPEHDVMFSLFNEHEQVVLTNLIRKSLVKRIVEGGLVSVRKNVQ
jgi:hypothetical protein